MVIERLTMRSDIAVPIKDRYLEDYGPGNVCEYGSVRLEEPDLIEFAGDYDPQAIHLSPELAKAGSFGGLIASGWQTLSVMTRLCCDNYISEKAFRGLQGADELRWLRPVRPGDCLSARFSVLEVSRLPGLPDQGVLRSLIELLNQNRETVMSIIARHQVLCRQLSEQASNGSTNESN